MLSFFRLAKRTQTCLQTLEIGLICTVFACALLLAITDIALRTFANNSLTWAQPVVRILVLWMGLLGALLATRNNEHITVDVLSKLLSNMWARWINAFVCLFACIVCAITAWYSVSFVYGGYEFGDTVLNNIPAWIAQIIIPISFILMALRFLILATQLASGTHSNGTKHEPPQTLDSPLDTAQDTNQNTPRTGSAHE